MTRNSAETAFEQERREALESAQAALAERPDDRITRSACRYLFRHLAKQEAEPEGLLAWRAVA